LKKLEKEY